MTNPTASTGAKPRSAARREFTWLLLTGVVGAGLVLFGTRQQATRVIILAPRPLPAAVVALRFADLQPAVAALAVAALASLAAVLATRRLLRRIVALITAAIAVTITLLAAEGVSRADALAAAARNAASPAGGAGAGSATAGAAGGSAVEPVTGLPAHVLPQGTSWRVLIIAGAVLLLATAITIAIRAQRLPVMSSRYGPAPGAGTATARPRRVSPGPAAPPVRGMWESLSAGADPTAWPGEDGP
jgi:uncharacterized membrane protein (TIGR02234 family)